MKKILALFVIGFSLTGTSLAQIVSLENPPSMSNGSFLSQQHFNFDGSSINWGTGTPGLNTGFFVQAFNDFGEVQLAFGEWNNAPYEVTSNPLAFNASVEQTPSWQGQRQTSGSAITGEYFGIRYDAGGGDFNYGWINITTSTAPEGGIINALAFNTIENQDILAGQQVIPEPSNAALFTALSAVAAIALRRRHNIQRG